MKKITSLNEEEIIDGSNIKNSEPINVNNPIEDYNEETDFDILAKLHKKAEKSADKAINDGNDIYVSELKEYGESTDTVGYFVIAETYPDDDNESYAIYQIGDLIYYRNAEEFLLIIEDFKDEVPGLTIESLKVSYSDKDADLLPYSITDEDDCKFIVSSIFSSLTGKSYDHSMIDESCKIRRNTKLGTDNDLDNSKAANDAKYGTKEENDFKQEIEDKQKKDGTVGALDPLEENASYKPKFPNKNLISEENIYESGSIIEYEVNDKVLYKGEYWDVFSITDNTGDKQHLKITRNGQTLDVTSNEVKPDPELLKQLEVPNLFEFDKNNLNKKPTNDKESKMKDLNGKTVDCNIVVDSMVLKETINGGKYKANLKDILEDQDNIRVYMDSDLNNPETWHKDNIEIEQENWPYAIIASEDDEPLRKIKVSPMSYVNAKEDTDLVDCLVADKLTLLPKHAIRIIA